MNVAPRYLGRESWLARRDPRVLILVVVIYVIGVIQVWDARIMLVALALAFAYYASGRIPWRAVRANWAWVLTFVGFVVTTNTIVTGGAVGAGGGPPHTLFSLPFLGIPVTAEAVSFGTTQLLRFLGMAAVGFPLAYCVAPSALGTAFARLHVPAKFAYALDLTWRFIPSLADDVRTTIDAQRVRGYEYEKAGRSPVGRLRRIIPILVPVTINAVVGAEDTIDAMDLRAFGTGPRTWVQELRFDNADRAVLLGFLAFTTVLTVVGFAGYARLWVFPFLLASAGG